MEISGALILKAAKVAGPIIAIAIGGAMAWQSLKQDVLELKADQTQTAIIRQQDHDTLVTHTQQLKDISSNVDEINHKLDRLVDKHESRDRP